MHTNLFSNAFNLALHSMVLLAGNSSESMTTAQIAEKLCASSHHLAKVHTRLARHGLIVSTRGPTGGLKLARSADDIVILDVYIAIEGPFHKKNCVFNHPVCDRSMCIFGTFPENFFSRLNTYFEQTRISDLIESVC